MSNKLLWVAGAAALALAMAAGCKTETDTAGSGGEGGDAGAGVGAQGGGGTGGSGGGTGGTAGGGGAPACLDCNDFFAKSKPGDQVCTGTEEDDFLALLDCLCGTADAAGKFSGPCQAQCKCANPVPDGADKGKAQEFTPSQECSTCASTSCSADLNKCTS